MVAQVLSFGVPEGIWWFALEPGEEDLGDIQDDVDDRDGYETSSDFGICSIDC